MHKPVDEEALKSVIHQAQKEKLQACSSSGANVFIERVNRLIRNAPLSQLSLEWVAERMGVHPTTLSKQYSLQTRELFVDAVVSRKLEEACKFLIESEKKIHEIGRKVGYENIQFFGKQFKKKYGMTPLEYRRKHQQGTILTKG